jgi:mannosyl-3-phosphoglycerate phosphatase
LNYVWGGRFHHILGKNDKGKAAQILKDLYKKEFPSIWTVGVGDSLNDLPMLLVVDHPIFIKGGGSFSLGALSTIQDLTIAEGAGPQAWNEAILNKLNELEN